MKQIQSEARSNNAEIVVRPETLDLIYNNIAGALDSRQRVGMGNIFHKILPIIDDVTALEQFHNKAVLVDIGLAKEENAELQINLEACQAFKACFAIENDRLVLQDPRHK